MMKTIFIVLFSLGALSSNEERVREILEKRWPSSTFTIDRVNGGLTNENYLVTLDGASYFLRYSSVDNHLLGVSLEGEWEVASKMALIGLTPKTIFHFPEDQIMASEYIVGSKERVDLRKRDVREKFCQMVRSLHNAEVTFRATFSPFDCIKKYEERAIDAGALLPTLFFEKVLPVVIRLEKELPQSGAVPCHLDLYSRNVLNDGKRLYLVDWEYAAMGDPLFDLSTAASADFFSDEEMEDLLEAYLERKPSKEEKEYFYQMRILADVRWSLWAYLQEKISPIDGSFLEMGESFLQEALKRIDSLSFIYFYKGSNDGKSRKISN